MTLKNASTDGTTKAMVDAGLKALRDWEASEDYRRDDCVRLIFEAMFSASDLRRALAAKQAQIDRLMLEHCPDEMTPEQIKEWKKHQVSVGPESA